MDTGIKEAHVRGMLDGFSRFAGIGLRNGRCSFIFEKIEWSGSVRESVAEYGKACALQDAHFMLSYGEDHYQVTKARTLRNSPYEEICFEGFEREAIKWLCYGLDHAGCTDAIFAKSFFHAAERAFHDLKQGLLDLSGNVPIVISIPSHPVCRIDVMQDEFILSSREQLYYLSFGWSD
jgi:hypothetical protein